MFEDAPPDLLDVEGTRVELGKLREHGPVPNDIGELTEMSKVRLAFAHELSQEIDGRGLSDIISVCPYLVLSEDVPKVSSEDMWEPDVDISFFVFSGKGMTGGYALSERALNYVSEKEGQIEFAVVAPEKDILESFEEIDGPILKLRVKFPHLSA